MAGKGRGWRRGIWEVGGKNGIRNCEGATSSVEELRGFRTSEAEERRKTT